MLRDALLNEVLWISAVPLFHLGSCAVACLLGKIKFTLTFPTNIYSLDVCINARVPVCLRTVSVRGCRFQMEELAS